MKILIIAVCLAAAAEAGPAAPARDKRSHVSIHIHDHEPAHTEFVEVPVHTHYTHVPAHTHTSVQAVHAEPIHSRPYVVSEHYTVRELPAQQHVETHVTTASKTLYNVAVPVTYTYTVQQPAVKHEVYWSTHHH